MQQADPPSALYTLCRQLLRGHQKRPPRFRTMTAIRMKATAAKRSLLVRTLAPFHSPAISPKALAKRMLAATNSMYPEDVPAAPTSVAPIP